MSHSAASAGHLSATAKSCRGRAEYLVEGVSLSLFSSGSANSRACAEDQCGSPLSISPPVERRHIVVPQPVYTPAALALASGLTRPIQPLVSRGRHPARRRDRIKPVGCRLFSTGLFLKVRRAVLFADDDPPSASGQKRHRTCGVMFQPENELSSSCNGATRVIRRGATLRNNHSKSFLQ